MRPYVTVHDAELDALLSPDNSSGGLLLGLSNPLFETRKGLPTSHSLLHVDAARNNANGGGSGGSAGGADGEADSCGSTPAVRWCSPQPTLVRADGRLLDQLSVRSSPIIRRREHGAPHRDGVAAAASAAVAAVAAEEEAADAAAATALGQHFGALTAGLLAPLERWQRTHACAHTALPPPWCTLPCHARPLTHMRPVAGAAYFDEGRFLTALEAMEPPPLPRSLVRTPADLRAIYARFVRSQTFKRWWQALNSREADAR